MIAKEAREPAQQQDETYRKTETTGNNRKQTYEPKSWPGNVMVSMNNSAITPSPNTTSLHEGDCGTVQDRHAKMAKRKMCKINRAASGDVGKNNYARLTATWGK